jgi:DNA polymerase-1
VRTSRTSSEDPNIQNWPKRGPKKYIRKQVAVKPGYKIVAIDYAGIQGRNVAMESLDKKLIEQFWNKYDIHSDWMRRLLKIVPRWHDQSEKDDPKEWKEKRNIVKNGFVFPTFFGSFPKSLARNLKIEMSDAEKLRDEFFSEYSDIHEWHKQLKADYLKTGYVTGLSGYRRYAPISPNEMINSPIQADEAIIVCAAQEALAKRSEELTSSMMIHDDLTFIWPEKRLDEYIDIAVYEMTKLRFPWINVPVEVEVSVGDNWADLEEIGKFEWGPGWDTYREIKK